MKVTTLILHDERRAFSCLLNRKGTKQCSWGSCISEGSPEKQNSRRRILYALATTVFIRSLVDGHLVVFSLRLWWVRVLWTTLCISFHGLGFSHLLGKFWEKNEEHKFYILMSWMIQGFHDEWFLCSVQKTSAHLQVVKIFSYFLLVSLKFWSFGSMNHPKLIYGYVCRVWDRGQADGRIWT